MRMRKPIALVFSTALFCLVAQGVASDPPKAKAATPAATAASAAAPMPGALADFWIFWPKAGHEAQFEAGVKTHLAWRKQAGEGWTWEAYQPVVGTDMGKFVYRSGDHHWADFDAQQAWETANKAGDAFNRDVAPHVERYEHIVDESDYAVSHWVESPDYRYFSVQTHKLVPGGSGAVREASVEIHAALQAGGWPMSYGISREIGGSGAFVLVFPHKSYADMADPKPGFMEVLAKGAGSAAAAKAMLDKFEGAVAEVDTTIYAARPDLSTQK